MSHPALPSLASRNAAFAFAGLLIGSIVGMSLTKGGFGQIGPDGDDIIRLVQLKDFLASQSWFDVSQSRMGPEGGTAMHWSRLVDVPILVIAGLIGLFTDQERALGAAVAIWPPLSMGLVIAGVWVGAKRLGKPHAVAFCMLAALAIMFNHYRFQPGAIDHHNVQLGLIALATGFVLAPSRDNNSLILAGIATALSVAIGVEVYAFAAIICAFVALDWALTGTPARGGAIWFGLALSATIAASFVATVSPRDYAVVACDALSSITLTAAVLGGGGLALVASLGSGKSRAVRIGSLIIIGMACIALFLLQAPECAASPLADLSPVTRDLWLSNIEEAASLPQSWSQEPLAVPFMFGVILLGIALCVLDIRAKRHTRSAILFLALLSVALLLSINQVRFYVFGHLIAIFPLGLWIGRLWRRGRSGKAHSSLYVGALALSIPFLWSIPFSVFLPDTASTIEPMDNVCLTPGTLDKLNEIETGLILAPTSLTPALLLHSDQRVLMGNYHRNETGIVAGIGMFAAAPPDAAALLSQYKVSYVIACPMDTDMIRYADIYPNGLAAALIAGDIPPYLTPVTDGLFSVSLTDVK